MSIVVHPRLNRVLIKRDDAEGKSRGGIILPDKAKDKPQRGVVLAVGPGRLTDQGYRLPVGLEQGNKVLFTKYSGEAFQIDEEEIFLVEDKDVIAVVEEFADAPELPAAAVRVTDHGAELMELLS
jgi:chaperonin GroES